MGNGAAVKSGIRRATGDYVLIVDGDGQHPPEEALRIVSRLGEYDLVIGARSQATQATQARRAGNGALNRLASYLTGREIPDLTSGFRGARASGSARVPAPAAQRVLHADDDDAGVPEGGLRGRVRTHSRAPAERPVQDQARARRHEVPDHHLQDRHAVQPDADLPADQRGLVPARRRATASGTS